VAQSDLLFHINKAIQILIKMHYLRLKLASLGHFYCLLFMCLLKKQNQAQLFDGIKLHKIVGWMNVCI